MEHPRSGKSSHQLYHDLVKEISPLYAEAESRQLIKMLLEEVARINIEKILVDEQVDLDFDTEKKLNQHLELLKQYYPIQYVLGKAHFYGRLFKVNNHVLIPRQETEELVNEILIDNARHGLRILDIGSGSGCIGITLGLELSDAKVTLLEVDSNAMNIAIDNAKSHGLQVATIVNDILTMDQLPSNYDIIVSNPPYVTESEKAGMLNNVLQHEPAKALFVPDHDPLVFYKKIVSLTKKHLKSRGRLYFEINENYGSELIRLCEQKGCSYVNLVKDLNGKDRIIKVMFD